MLVSLLMRDQMIAEQSDGTLGLIGLLIDIGTSLCSARNQTVAADARCAVSLPASPFPLPAYIRG